MKIFEKNHKKNKKLQNYRKFVIHLLTSGCYDVRATTNKGSFSNGPGKEVQCHTMTDKELKKLHRRDLLELLVQQTEDNEGLQSQIDVLTMQLQSRNLNISKAGSLAEAVMQINEMFRTADAVAKQYLDNVRGLVDRQEEVCAQMEQECQERCEEMLAEAERECEAKKQEAEAFWQEISGRLDRFYNDHNGLRELLAVRGIQP